MTSYEDRQIVAYSIGLSILGKLGSSNKKRLNSPLFNFLGAYSQHFILFLGT
jgi:hypothetical protein